MWRDVASWAIAGLLALAAVIGLAALRVNSAIHAPGPLQVETAFTAPSGAGLGRIAAALERQGIVRDASVFRRAAQLRGVESRLQAGSYAIPPGASAADVLTMMTRGRTATYRFTAPEGWSHAQIRAALEAEDRLEGRITRMPEEGWLAPNTYFFTPGRPRQAMIDQMEQAQRQILRELWPGRTEGLPLSTQREALTLASIIEKETGVSAERARVAAVFVNRLNRRPRPMRLQADSTVEYGVGEGVPLGRGLTRRELRAQTPYNTYRINGLPPTAIANPGRAAIAAALNPDVTDEFYFVADGSGGHAFAETLQQHERNVRRWRAIERGGGQ